MLKLFNIQKYDTENYDYDGRTPIGVAASAGNLEAVKYLACHGSNLQHIDARGNSAI